MKDNDEDTKSDDEHSDLRLELSAYSDLSGDQNADSNTSTPTCTLQDIYEAEVEQKQLDLCGALEEMKTTALQHFNSTFDGDTKLLFRCKSALELIRCAVRSVARELKKENKRQQHVQQDKETLALRLASEQLEATQTTAVKAISYYYHQNKGDNVAICGIVDSSSNTVWIQEGEDEKEDI